ncbi:hypothetical protein V2A60_005451 [Cordyceps javanica]|uniref:RTA1 like protein n=1 Tax=Cordyceps javanica TaxID=43265 RepID=A0A545VEH0_9HYPO|nr:RTA1 like protein [Cordyceps javanica]TQW10292.1 RTA1 like protein [Cordyceps javanica]
MSSYFKQRPEGIFGANSPCNLDKCPVEWSMFGYRPSLVANVLFLALFAVIGLVHAYFGIRWRSWGFMTGMLLGCTGEILGYVGRIMLWNNPFSYYGFMIQIICLTTAPVFFTASIYVTLSKTIIYYAPDLSRFRPQLFYWVFIPFDVVCLILQAIGGALSTALKDNKRLGVDISMAGLILQVIVIAMFMGAFSDYMLRLVRSGRSRAELKAWRSIAFFSGLVAACIFILARCAYRVVELKDGYSSKLFREETPFIVLEGVILVFAGISLMFGNPGLVFDKPAAKDGAAVRDKHARLDSEENGIPMESYESGAGFASTANRG